MRVPNALILDYGKFWAYLYTNRKLGTLLVPALPATTDRNDSHPLTPPPTKI